MSTKFQDKYRISSARLHNWDYAWNAIYFVTINTYAGDELFGEIKNEKMQLSNLGVIANVLWFEIKNHFAVVELDAFVVMPNHVHGILAINNPQNYLKEAETGHALSVQKGESEDGVVDGSKAVKTGHVLSQEDTNVGKTTDEKETVKARHALSQEENKAPGDKRFQNPGKNSLSSIIGSYKSAVSKHAHRLGYEFDWHSRFHDSIVRDEIGLLKARKYIENNIVNWDKDEFNTPIS